MVWDVQIWKLTFHAKGMASEIGPDGKFRCNLATAPPKFPQCEKIKKILAKALTRSWMVVRNRHKSPAPFVHFLGYPPTSGADNIGYTAPPGL